ncbi:transmembrane protein 258-like protein, partial [Dinothrombium tinctorium]
MVLTNNVLQSYVPYEAPISPSSFLHLTLLFIITGLLFMAWFFTIEVTTHSSFANGNSDRRGTKVFKELIISFLGSLFLGVGSIFFILSI